MSISQLNQNDVEGAALALAALEITQPGIEEEDEYGDEVDRILTEYCPLWRVPEEIRTPAEEDATVAMREAVQDRSRRMVKKLLSSGDPLLRALAGRQRTAAQ
ncbi:MAG: hypothetical protein ACYDCG_19835 [Candidatus Acidiferrales bacterium]